MLFEPDRHEPLLDSAWDAERAHAAIRTIVADMEDARGADATWPWHPLDRESEMEPRHKSMYLGAAGVLWALWYLQQVGAVALHIEPPALIGRVHAAYLAEPDTGAVVPSYFLGEAGILLAQWRMNLSQEAADRLAAAVARNIAHPANEPLWAAPGTMLAALHMLRWTSEQRWRDLYLENVEQLWRTWLPRENPRCHVWTQDLYGQVVQYLGAAHGFAGNAYALLRGADLMPAAQRETLYERCVETLAATAVVEGDGVNWPPTLESSNAGSRKMLLQWCHGAPGIVTAFADFPRGRSHELDAMLAGAGISTWRAGPLAKGPGLCHGTAGNGYAFLKLYRRTGDALWLDRARAFAMHAIVQSERARQHYGQRRYTLWTGDAGLAIYLWHCITGAGDVPGIDVLDPHSAGTITPGHGAADTR
jgi:lantibiotic modifying enzyme